MSEEKVLKQLDSLIMKFSNNDSSVVGFSEGAVRNDNQEEDDNEEFDDNRSVDSMRHT